MKKAFLSLLVVFLCICAHRLSAQVVDDVAGKTYYYYDSLTHKKIKEVFHHKQVVKMIPDPTDYGSYKDTSIYIKSGPYTRYFENGKLDCSGYYVNERKDSVWKFYDNNGALIRVEKYRNGQLIKS
jgi:hypothetical protein